MSFHVYSNVLKTQHIGNYWPSANPIFAFYDNKARPRGEQLVIACQCVLYTEPMDINLLRY